jgi:two-component system LytT family response regulator
MRALIVDDERPARVKLHRMLAGAPDVEIVGEAADGRAAIEAIHRLSPDVVFLDIQMPFLDGFGVVEAVGVERMPAVVFVTAYDEHALHAFEVQALDYLLKPVAPERLQAVLARLQRVLAGRGSAADLAEQLAAVMKLVGRQPWMVHLLVWHNERAHLVPVDQIEWLEADRNSVRVHAADRQYAARGTLSELENRLDPARFLRVSRSAIVRLASVRELQPWFHGDYRLILRGGATLMWSRRYRAKQRDAFELRR